jgi:hypothetical protein
MGGHGQPWQTSRISAHASCPVIRTYGTISDMGGQEDYPGVVAEIACRLVLFIAWFVLLTIKSLLVFGGPALLVSLIVLPFMKNPLAPWNGLEIAGYFVVASGWILAWAVAHRAAVRERLPAARAHRRQPPGGLDDRLRQARAAYPLIARTR